MTDDRVTLLMAEVAALRERLERIEGGTLPCDVLDLGSGGGKTVKILFHATPEVDGEASIPCVGVFQGDVAHPTRIVVSPDGTEASSALPVIVRAPDVVLSGAVSATAHNIVDTTGSPVPVVSSSLIIEVRGQVATVANGWLTLASNGYSLTLAEAPGTGTLPTIIYAERLYA